VGGGQHADAAPMGVRQKFLRDALVLVFVLGLAVHVAGYLLISAGTGEPVSLLADLLSTLGTTLWTGVVLVVFLEVLPEARRRGFSHRLEAYEAALRDQGRLTPDAGPPDGPVA
jgi:hypothetical protein